MGCCVSKNCPSRPPTLPPPQSATVADICSATPPQTFQVPDPINKTPQANKENDATKKFVKEKQAEVEDSKHVKKEIFVIEHRRSHEKRKSFDQKARELPVSPEGFGSVSASNETAAEVCDTPPTESVTTSTNNNDACLNSSVRVRTSSFTKEEVDAILIQCGKLSRSNSVNKATPSSGRKRRANSENNDDCYDDEEKRHRRRQSRSGSQERRRRTPSREREQQGRSNSRERVSSSGRRVSRSPGKRNGAAAAQVNCNASCSSNDTNGKPGKMVSVPATVTSIVADKGNSVGDGLENANNAAIKRIQVKRNASEAAGPRGGASPRTMSPARANNRTSCENQARAISPARGHFKASCENQARAMSPARGHNKVGGENQARGAASPRAKSPARGNQQQPSLNRSSSRKEHSPHRRNPLGEIDQNSLLHPQLKNTLNRRRQNRSRDFDEDVPIKESANNPNQPKPNVEMNKERASYKRKETMDNCIVSKISIEKEHQQSTEDAARQSPLTADNTTTSGACGAENLKPQTLRRSRSSRQSRDLDINPENLEKPTSSYTALLLEDIQNFHQKSNNNGASVPPCVIKACSIVEAVDDLTSTTNPSVEPFVF